MRPSAQLLVYGEDNAANLSRAVVIGERIPVALGVRPEISCRRLVRFHVTACVLEMDVDVNGGQAFDVKA